VFGEYIPGNYVKRIPEGITFIHHSGIGEIWNG